MHGAPLVNVRPVEVVAVVGDDDVGLELLEVAHEALEQALLVRLVEDVEEAGELGLGRVLERLHVCRDDLPVDNQVAGAVHHV